MSDPSSEGKYARPYPHQVGGHGQLAMTATGQLLKPLLEKEYRFYKYIHSDDLPSNLHWIRHFTPKFYGETDFPNIAMPPCDSPSVQVNNATTGTIDGLTSTSTTEECHTKSDAAAKSTKSTDAASKSADSVDSANADNVNYGSNCEGTPSTPLWRTADGVSHTPANMSPWVATMRLRTPKSSTNPPRKPRRSIALEDINRQFINPCVMDCKIGTRHYDDDASAEKRRRHIEKANATTTAKCGVRYTGMQSFKRTLRGGQDGVFETMDKYHGRTLREEDLVPEATWFFHNNFDVRGDCVQLILNRLIDLRRRLMEQNHFFFYSSSLLLVYEGALNGVVPTRVDVRMIDFAHTVLSNGSRDDGYLIGINYLIRILSDILKNERCNERLLPLRTLSLTDT